MKTVTDDDDEEIDLDTLSVNDVGITKVPKSFSHQPNVLPTFCRLKV